MVFSKIANYTRRLVSSPKKLKSRSDALDKLIVGDTCEVCHWNGRGNYYLPAGFLLHENRLLLAKMPGERTQQLFRSAISQGCLCCAVLWQLIDKCLISEVHDTTIEIHLLSKGFFTVECQYKYGDASAQEWMFAVPEHWETAVRLVDAWKRDEAAVIPSLPQLDLIKQTAISRDTSSDAGLAWARSKLSDCAKNHTRCRNTSGFLPSRLIDVSPQSSNADVVLRERKDIPPNAKYVALSHCWGPNGETEIKCRTLRKNFESQTRCILWSSLSRTFQDAVDFTRRLGLRYIWIDCVCIIQKDEADWNIEAPLMFKVYHNAWVTLAAHHARTSLEGLYSKSSPERETRITLPREVTTKLTKNRGSCIKGGNALELIGLEVDAVCPHLYKAALDSSKRRQVGLTAGGPHDGQRPVHKDRYSHGPLFTRAWTFQEREIAPRLLVFTANDLVWQCKTTAICQCKNKSTSIKTSLFEGNPQLQSSKELTARDLDDLWWNMVEQYSSLGVTNADDKLPAIAAIAKQMYDKHRSTETYLAGLWSSSFIRDLLWVSRLHDFQPRSGRPKNPKSDQPEWWPAPSWSWASIQDPVEFLGRDSLDANRRLGRKISDVEQVADIIQKSCKNALGNDFMKPQKSACNLVIRGRTAHANLRKHLRDGTQVVFSIELTNARERTVIYNKRAMDIDVRSVFMDYDPLLQYLPPWDESHDAGIDGQDDDDSYGDNSDYDFEERDSPGDLGDLVHEEAQMEVDLIEIAYLKNKRNSSEYAAVFMILKREGESQGNDSRACERLGLICAWADMEERFITGFDEATMNRPTQTCSIV